jgi:hypothetical protein
MSPLQGEQTVNKVEEEDIKLDICPSIDGDPLTIAQP